jgi:hypothetical protein
LIAAEPFTQPMNKRSGILSVIINILAALGAVGLFVAISSRPALDVGISTERIEATAARLAKGASQSAIAEVLHRDESYIRSLVEAIEAHRNLLRWIVVAFTVVAALNIFHASRAFLQRNRNAAG